MNRRDALRGIGAVAAITLVPAEIREAWNQVSSGSRPPAGLTDAHLGLIEALCAEIIPRTDTPGAVDVGVPAFIDALVSASWSDTDRSAFQGGMDALQQYFSSASGERLTSRIEAIEAGTDRRRDPERTYWQLKSLIVHGYFTSEQVMKEVLRVEVMPGRFDGAAPLTLRRAPSSSGARGGYGHA